MAGPQHALILRSKGQGHVVIRCAASDMIAQVSSFLFVLVGLTVLKADQVYDIMERDYPEKFKVCPGMFLMCF